MQGLWRALLLLCGSVALTLLLLCTVSVTGVSAQQRGGTFSSASVTFSSSDPDGGEVSLTTSGNANASASVTSRGRTRNVTAGSTGSGTDSVRETLDFGGNRMPADESEPVAAVPKPQSEAEASEPEESLPPGPAAAGPVDGEEGDVRLVNQVDVNGFVTGTLQVFCDGAWGLDCDTNFDNRDALVACRQLGFTTGTSITLRPLTSARELPPEEEQAPFVLENLGCSGEETTLLDCPLFLSSEEALPPLDYVFYYQSRSFPGVGGCDHASDTIARVACGMADAAGEGDVRIAPASSVVSEDGSAEYGRLEVFSNGGWGTVCDVQPDLRPGPREVSELSRAAADVACRQLGYQQGFHIQSLEDPDEDATARVPIVLAGPDCQGAEQALADCPGFRLAPDLTTATRCTHEDDVHVVCSSALDPDLDGSTRLQAGGSGPGYEYGRLEVFLRGFWSNVCRSGGFPPDTAQVACRELGFDGGSSLRFVRPSQSFARTRDQVLSADLPVALAAVGCEGDEESLSDCPRNDGVVDSCNQFRRSTVLACAETTEGCDQQEGTTEGSVRLRGGFGTPCDPLHTGFIEVLHDNEWGRICTDSNEEDRGTNNLVADVVCRQLGFPYGTRVDPRPAVAPDSPSSVQNSDQEQVDRYWLLNSEVSCTGPEQGLLECDLGGGFGDAVNQQCQNDVLRGGLFVACRQFPVAEALEGVTTPGAEEGDLRLVNETVIDNWVTGQLQVFLDGSWGQVCSGRIDAADANVACRQLGFSVGTAAGQVFSAEDGESLESRDVFPDVAITAPGCDGTEARLVDCAVQMGAAGDVFFGPECRGRDSLGLVLGCVSEAAEGTEGAFRLTNMTAGGSPGAESGVLEVFHAGAWGSICNGGFTFFPSVAAVACREMGFQSGIARNEDVSAPVLPPWLSGLRCSGSEEGLAACERPSFGDTDSCGFIQRLFCYTDNSENGQARLVGGSADPAGQWEYGRLEVLVNGFWSILNEVFNAQDFGRRGAEVACRSLGFAAGAQLLVGATSPFPLPSESVVPALLRGITCNGTESSLGECSFDTKVGDSRQSTDEQDAVQLRAVSLVCSNPSGCAVEEGEPEEGDIRLVAINGTTSETAPCDAVHHGAVELFRDGRWGRICTGTRGDASAAFTVDARVVCRQLGFPFGSLMDEGEVVATDDYEYAYAYGYSDDTGDPTEEDSPLTWATQVVCTGKEERLLDCDFPENFGGDGNGISDPPCGLEGNNRLAVVCRRFEITESNLIRR